MKIVSTQINAGQTSYTPLEPLLTEQQYSSITGKSVATARRDRTLRQGCPWIKLGALVRYRPEDVRAYIAQSARATTEVR